MQTEIEKVNNKNINEVISLSIEQFGKDWWTPSQFHDCLTNKNYLFFLIRKNKKISAFLLAHDLIDSVNLLLIATGKEYKNTGLATLLIEHLFKIARKRDIKVWLEVNKNNLPAVTLYKKLGFTFLYERKNYYSDGSSALIFEKTP